MKSLMSLHWQWNTIGLEKEKRGHSENSQSEIFQRCTEKTQLELNLSVVSLFIYLKKYSEIKKNSV